MANTTIPQLPVAITLDGTEQLELVQPPGSGGTSKRATAAQIAGLASLGGGNPASAFVLTTANPVLINSRVIAGQSGVTNITDNGAQSSIVVGIVNNGIGNTQLRQGSPLSIIGVAGNSTANVADIVASAANQALIVNQGGTGLTFGFINVTATLTGTLTVPEGGTGQTTLPVHGILIGAGTSAISISSAMAAGQLLVGQGTASDPIPLTLIGDIGSITSGGTATINTAAVTYAKFQQIPGLSVHANSSSVTAVSTAVVGAANQVLIINPAATGLLFGQVNLSSTSAVTGSLNATSYLTGIVSVPLGGTGTGTLTANGLIAGNTTASVQIIAADTGGKLLLAQGTATLPAFQTVTGDLSSLTSSGSATIANNAVTYAKFQQLPGLSVHANTSSSTANSTSVVGTTNAVLIINPQGTGLLFGQVNLAATAAVTGNLQIQSFNGGASASTATFWRGDGQWITPAGAGTVTSVSAGTGLSGGTITTAGTISLTSPVTVSLGGTGTTTLTNHGLLVGAGTTSVTVVAVPASGTILQGNSGADPTWTATPTHGVQGTTRGTLALAGSTTGTVTIQPNTSGTVWSMTLPANTGTSGQFLQTDGTGTTSWAAAAGGSVTFISEATASNSATLDFTGLTNAYETYMLVLTNLVPATNGVVPWIRVGTGGTPTYQTTSYVNPDASSTDAMHFQPTSVDVSIDNTANYGISGILYFTNLSGAAAKYMYSSVVNYKSSAVKVPNTSSGWRGLWDSTTAVTAIRFMFSSGSASAGTIALYGIKNS